MTETLWPRECIMRAKGHQGLSTCHSMHAHGMTITKGVGSAKGSGKGLLGLARTACMDEMTP